MAGTTQDRGVAVITGSVAGIGRGAAVRLARGGFAVACLDIQDPAPAVEAVREAGGTAQAFRCDVRSEAEVSATLRYQY